MYRCAIAAFLLLLPFSASSAVSGPVIHFDTTIVDCGTVIEGKTDKLDATFIVRNTGDQVLKLEKVRPGCGCTVVRFDSLVEPGKSSEIRSQVKITGYRAGSLSKSITVTSNAENETTVRLIINARIQAIIGLSERYIQLSAPDTATPKTLFLNSRKKDLAVSAVSFTSNDKTGAAAWESALKLNLRFTFTPLDSSTADGSRVFRLDIYPPAAKISAPGAFTVTTNHNDKKEIVLQGKIGT
jgi:hypothetical protein